MSRWRYYAQLSLTVSGSSSLGPLNVSGGIRNCAQTPALCVLGTIRYNGTTYYYSNNVGLGLVVSSTYLLVYVNQVTTSLGLSPNFTVSVSGSYNNDGVLSNSLVIQTFGKTTYTVNGQLYYGVLLTWSKINSTTFAGLATANGYIDVSIQWTY